MTDRIVRPTSGLRLGRDLSRWVLAVVRLLRPHDAGDRQDRYSLKSGCNSCACGTNRSAIVGDAAYATALRDSMAEHSPPTGCRALTMRAIGRTVTA